MSLIDILSNFLSFGKGNSSDGLSGSVFPILPRPNPTPPRPNPIPPIPNPIPPIPNPTVPKSDVVPAHIVKSFLDKGIEINDDESERIDRLINKFKEEKLLYQHDKKYNKELEKGDVVGVHRFGYEHYGVYIGDSQVIHYSSQSSDISNDNIIIETSFDDFLKNSKKYFVINFDYINEVNYKLLMSAKLLGILDIEQELQQISKLLVILDKNKRKQIYTPDETVERAQSRLGESQYNLMTNNCEHFAIWCKTGVSESSQVDALLGVLPRIILNN